jgi:hypothetical protein
MNGKLRAHGLIKDLKKIEGHPFDVELREPNAAFAEIAANKGGTVLDVRSHTYRIIAPGIREDAARFLLACAKDADAQIRGLVAAERSLEDVFLNAISTKPTFDIPGAQA